MAQSEHGHVSGAESAASSWQSLYRLGGITALLAVVVAFAEIGITFLPSGGRTPIDALTVADWFALFQDNWFMGLRNLGLMNMIGIALLVPTFLALCAAHRRVNPAYAALALLVNTIGVTIYAANNTAFAMLTLSQQYAAAASDPQRVALLAAGESLLAQGQSHTAGTFLGFFITEIATLLICLVMLRGGVFGKATATVGILAYGLFLIFDVLSAFVPAAFEVAMVFAMGGGLLTMAWYILIARELLRLGRGSADTAALPGLL
jgi:hypothetical protein